MEKQKSTRKSPQPCGFDGHEGKRKKRFSRNEKRGSEKRKPTARKGPFINPPLMNGYQDGPEKRLETMSDEKKRTTKKKREKRPRALLDVSMFPHDEKGNAIVPDPFFDDHYRELPEGTYNESKTYRAYSGGKLYQIGSTPEKDIEIQRAGADRTNATLAERKTFCDSISQALRKRNTDGLSNMERITASMIIKAIDGDVKAAQFIRDTIGEQPTTKTEIQADVMTPADRALIEKLQKRIENRG